VTGNADTDRQTERGWKQRQKLGVYNNNGWREANS